MPAPGVPTCLSPSISVSVLSCDTGVLSGFLFPGAPWQLSRRGTWEGGGGALPFRARVLGFSPPLFCLLLAPPDWVLSTSGQCVVSPSRQPGQPHECLACRPTRPPCICIQVPAQCSCRAGVGPGGGTMAVQKVASC